MWDALNSNDGDETTEQPLKLKLHRIDAGMQERLSCLMSKNNEGALTPKEVEELAELGSIAEELSLEKPESSPR